VTCEACDSCGIALRAFRQQAKDFLSDVENPVVEKPFDIRAVRMLVNRSVAA
jgi:hypothetical protein